MRPWFKQTFDGPQIWLTIGAVMIAFSMLVRYHQDQRLADAALSERVDLPSPVAIQDFAPDVHSNMLGEFQLLAETDLSEVSARTIGAGDMQEAYLLVPAYPVSDSGREQANERLRNASDGNRPISRSATRTAGSRQTMPIAILVYDVSSGTAASPNVYGLGLRSLGAGLDGDVVIFAGKMFDRAMWQDAFTGTEFDAALVDFLGEGADSLPLIAPYRAHKSFGVAVPDLSRLENVYLAFGIAFFILGGAMLVRRQAPGPKRQARKPGPAAPRKASLPPFTFFQPIVSQEELIDADEDVSLLAHIPKFMNRAADAAARGGKTPVKSRP